MTCNSQKHCDYFHNSNLSIEIKLEHKPESISNPKLCNINVKSPFNMI